MSDPTPAPSEASRAFRTARDQLLAHREDLETARREFVLPAMDTFNWATDWFDVVAAEQPTVTALHLVEPNRDTRISYAELSLRSQQVAGWLWTQGLATGRPGAARARQRGAVVGGDARLHPAGCGADPGHDPAVARRRRRPDRARPGPRGGGGHRGHAAVRRRRRRLPQDRRRPRRRTRRGARLGAVRTDPRPRHPRRGRQRRRGAAAGHPAGRHPAAVLHVGDDRAAQAGRAHARVVPDRAPVDDVLDRTAARRRAPQRVVVRVGKTCLVMLLRPVHGRRHRAGVRLPAVRPAGPAADDDRARGDDVLRTADGVADAGPGGPRRPGGRRCASWWPPASRSTPR